MRTSVDEEPPPAPLFSSNINVNNTMNRGIDAIYEENDEGEDGRDYDGLGLGSDIEGDESEQEEEEEEDDGGEELEEGQRVEKDKDDDEEEEDDGTGGVRRQRRRQKGSETNNTNNTITSNTTPSASSAAAAAATSSTYFGGAMIPSGSSNAFAWLAQPRVWREQRRKLAQLRSELFQRTWKSGWLVKQGHIRKNWKRRWFELRGYDLSYSKKAPPTSLQQKEDQQTSSEKSSTNNHNTPGSGSTSLQNQSSSSSSSFANLLSLTSSDAALEPAGILDIRDNTFEKASIARSPLCLRLSAKKVMGQEYLICAESEADFVAWVKVLSSAMRAWEDLGRAVGALQIAKSASLVLGMATRGSTGGGGGGGGGEG